jgi:hypothetical protein
MGLTTRESWFHFWLGQEVFLFSSVQTGSLGGGIQPPGRWVLAVKWPGYKADHSPVSIVEVKNKWRYTSSAPYAVMACSWSTSPFYVLILSVESVDAVMNFPTV